MLTTRRRILTNQKQPPSLAVHATSHILCARAQLQQSSALLSFGWEISAIPGGSCHLALPVLALSCSKAVLCFLAEPRGVTEDLFFDWRQEIQAHYGQAS